MTCISLDPVFDLAISCDASMPLYHPYPKAQQKPISSRIKKKVKSKPLVRIIHIERSRVSFKELALIRKTFKISGKKE